MTYACVFACVPLFWRVPVRACACDMVRVCLRDNVRCVCARGCSAFVRVRVLRCLVMIMRVDARVFALGACWWKGLLCVQSRVSTSLKGSNGAVLLTYEL